MTFMSGASFWKPVWVLSDTLPRDLAGYGRNSGELLLGAHRPLPSGPGARRSASLSRQPATAGPAWFITGGRVISIHRER